MQREGDITSRLDGSYRFVPGPDGGTQVIYTLSVELRVAIPGFVRRRAEGHILHGAVRDLKARVESGALSPCKRCRRRGHEAPRGHPSVVFGDRRRCACRRAVEAEDAGLHGVFCYDHLWPMGEPVAPAISACTPCSARCRRADVQGRDRDARRARRARDTRRVGRRVAHPRCAERRAIHRRGRCRRPQERGGEQRLRRCRSKRRRSVRRSSKRSPTRLRQAGVETWIGGGGATTNAIAEHLGCGGELLGGAATVVARTAAKRSGDVGGHVADRRGRGGERSFGAARGGSDMGRLHWPGSADALGVEAAAAGGDRARRELSQTAR